MNVPNQLTREYKISDDTMLQDSRTIIKEFYTDKVKFIALDDDFKDPFEADWQAAITAAETAPTDEQIVDSQTALTQDVESIMSACRQHFQDAKYFIEKTFPNKSAIWNEFGYDNYEVARKSPEKMIVFMQVFNKVANKYKTDLIAKKYTQAQIDEILTKRQALIDAKTNQELAKNARGGFTQSRVELLNSVWNFRLAVARAAKQIFANNYARYKIYLLPASEESDTIFSIKGTITDAITGKPIENATISWEDQSTTTDSNGKYGISKLNSGSVIIKYEATGYIGVDKTVEYKDTLLVVDVALSK